MSSDEPLEVGDLVKWYDMYACDTIVKDTGVGLVLRAYMSTDIAMGHLHVQEYAIERLLYDVHCLKLSDIRTFPARDVVAI